MLNRTTERDSSPKSHGTRTETFGKLFGSCWATKATSFAEAIARWEGPKLAAKRLYELYGHASPSLPNPGGFPCRALPGTLKFRPDGPIAKEIGQTTFPRRKCRRLCACGSKSDCDMKNNVWRAVVEVGFIVFLFYSNLLMGEMERTASGRDKGLLWNLHDIFTWKISLSRLSPGLSVTCW